MNLPNDFSRPDRWECVVGNDKSAKRLHKTPIVETRPVLAQDEMKSLDQDCTGVGSTEKQ